MINFPILTGVTEGPATLLPWLLVVAAIGGLVIGIARSRTGNVVDLAVDPPQSEDAPVNDTTAR